MAIYFESYEEFKQKGGLKQSTITAQQLLPALVAHMVRMDRKFSLQVNGRLPKSMDALLAEAFSLCHLQQPFYTQHCASRHSRYMNVSKSRVKIDFTLQYRMTREQEKWVTDEIERILQTIITPDMTNLQKIILVHDYIVRAYDYELHTEGSPFTVYTFMHEKQGVCMAYALLFEKMMAQLSVPCYYVVGHANGEGDNGHAWNMVQLDGQWYHIDATWNDLGKRTQGHEIRYRYFLRSDASMKQDHQWNLSHYPICHSERFQRLANVYDAAYLDGRLYFPHPRTSFLTSYCTLDEKFKALVSTRVQLCTVFNGMLYLSNVDDGGYLYEYEPLSKQLIVVEQRQVLKMEVTEQQLVVYFTEGESMTLQLQATVQSEQTEQQIAYETIPFLQFDQSWFATYEGDKQALCFEGTDGVKLVVQQPVQQLTVDVQFDKTLDIQMTANRKNVQFEVPALLYIPKKMVGQDVAFKQSSGQLLPVKMHEEIYIVEVMKSTEIIIG